MLSLQEGVRMQDELIAVQELLPGGGGAAVCVVTLDLRR
jgi:hypothetical protein